MFQLSKKVEYALIAIRHIAAHTSGQICTTKEIAERYHIPYELLAKVMQKLAKEKFISSYQGVHGGYTLLKQPTAITVSSIINAIEGKPTLPIIQCEADAPDNCCIHDTCTIKDPLVKLQGNINKVFEQMTIMELVG